MWLARGFPNSAPHVGAGFSPSLHCHWAELIRLTALDATLMKKRGKKLIFAILAQCKPFRCNIYEPPATVDSKPLTVTLSPLDATFTKNRGMSSFQTR